MEDYETEFGEESSYLQMVRGQVSRSLEREELAVLTEKQRLMELNRQMWANTVHFSEDFARLTEANQELGDIQTRAAGCRLMAERVRRYQKMKDSPYFARIDFTEDGYPREPVYIGVGSLTGDDGLDVYVYDWRAPICSLFYRCEPGRVRYQSPSGEIAGEMSLKRQYEIKNGQLRYFFDSSVNIMDEMLRGALAKNAPTQMKSIVETIQREQDAVIRDVDSDLLMVQGVAGSGKTSVALHRVAYLMYQGLSSGLKSDNIMILSPNELFGEYIAGVLPELGEDNIATLTFEDLFHRMFGADAKVETRARTLERLMAGGPDAEPLLQSMQFQMSDAFAQILDRLAAHYERAVEFTDIEYGGVCIATREQLRAQLLQKRVNMPVAKRLRVIEEKLLERVRGEKKRRIAELERFVRSKPEHQFEVKQQARLLSMRESSAVARQIQAFTRVDAKRVYESLFADEALFFRLAQGVELPPDARERFACIARRVRSGRTGYADAMALLYLRAQLCGDREDSRIRQVVVDEAQDYYPLQYRVLALLLPGARYTLLGDVGQTLTHEAPPDFYEEIRAIFDKKKSTLARLGKSFRCSSEISAFSRRFLPEGAETETFERHEQEPSVLCAASLEEQERRIAGDLEDCMAAGLGTAAVLCKSMAQARGLAARLRDRGASVRLCTEDTRTLGPGLYVLPIYMAKGLEFDAALLYNVDASAYSGADGRRLLYVACTRALHRLYVYYTGEPSPLLQISAVENADA